MVEWRPFAIVCVLSFCLLVAFTGDLCSLLEFAGAGKSAVKSLPDAALPPATQRTSSVPPPAVDRPTHGSTSVRGGGGGGGGATGGDCGRIGADGAGCAVPLTSAVDVGGGRDAALNSPPMEDELCPSWMEKKKRRSSDLMHPYVLALVHYVFDRVAIICYNVSCRKHREGGGAWPADLQHKVYVQDGQEIDQVYKGTFSKLRKPGHKEKVWFSHMHAVQAAAQAGANTTLVFEDDAAAAANVQSEFRTCSNIMRFIRPFRKTLSEISWGGVKFGASYQTAMAWQGNVSVCKCNCTVPHAWREAEYAGNQTLCHTPYGVCDIRDSEAYALHRSTYPAAIEALRVARERLEKPEVSLLGRNKAFGFMVDVWYARWVDWHHVLPNSFLQPKKRGTWGASLKFLNCVAT